MISILVPSLFAVITYLIHCSPVDLASKTLENIGGQGEGNQVNYFHSMGNIEDILKERFLVDLKELERSEEDVGREGEVIMQVMEGDGDETVIIKEGKEETKSDSDSHVTEAVKKDDEMGRNSITKNINNQFSQIQKGEQKLNISLIFQWIKSLMRPNLSIKLRKQVAKTLRQELTTIASK